MTHQTMVGSEPHPTLRGRTLRWYATVDIAMLGIWWHWRTIDHMGKFASPVSTGYATEDEAKDDALKTLQGDWWE